MCKCVLSQYSLSVSLFLTVEIVELTLKQEISIIDSDDIAANPAVMMEKYCNRVGFRYSDELLKWTPGIPDDWIIPKTILKMQRDFNWLGNAINSSGWGVGVNRKGSPEEEFPDELYRKIDEAIPYYNKLRAHPSFIHV